MQYTHIYRIWHASRHIIYSFRNFPCIHTLYIFNCRLRLTISRRSIPSCSIVKRGFDEDIDCSIKDEWIWVAMLEGICAVDCAAGSREIVERFCVGCGVCTGDSISFSCNVSVLSSSSTVDSVLDVRKAAGTAEPVNNSASSSVPRINMPRCLNAKELT